MEAKQGGLMSLADLRKKLDKFSEPSNGCRIWTGFSSKYGRVRVNGIQMSAHRAAYIASGLSIPSGYFICHTCDNPLCINPEHLFAGTPAENSADMTRKGRQAYGEKNPTAKLNQAKADSIRLLRKEGSSRKELAKMFSVSEAAVKDVLAGRYWKPRNAARWDVTRAAVDGLPEPRDTRQEWRPNKVA